MRSSIGPSSFTDRPVTKTVAPCCASSRATPRPMPCAAPVTTATRPSRFMRAITLHAAQILMHGKDGGRTLADSRGNPAVGVRANISDREDPRHVGLEHQRIAVQTPALTVLARVGARENEALAVG